MTTLHKVIGLNFISLLSLSLKKLMGKIFASAIPIGMLDVDKS